MLNIISRCYNCRVKYFPELCRLYSTKTDKLKNNQQIHDLIGPPDPVSNLRPIKFAHSAKESYFEKRYIDLRENTQQWNQEFWLKHNTNFSQECKRFQELLRAQGKTEITADDMSVFYKQFLDKNWQSHFNYNVSWYKRNIKILLYGIAAKISKLKIK
ncbi:cytochrome c oxidase assembly factor 8 [Cataglyphis hispanica]|uniref:cytochrome c oxidase assembly factor 8 n=1 Tax=Cataglyphis hispanica TaxID=1086592 RepID=UPI00217FC528|nr:cytochrome c oxidase assembly factor 8 [Cataglyphis hispanica]